MQQEVKMTNAKQVYQALRKSLEELSSEDVDISSRDGTLAAELHGYYNQVGLKAGWLKPEYATALSMQDHTNKRKNISAARDVLEYWVHQFEGNGSDFEEGIVVEMQRAVNYEQNRGNIHLEAASDSQHEQWKRFVAEYQSERVTPGSPKFRQDNYDQFNAPYVNLSEKVKDQDRLVVAVITDNVLERSEIGYERVIRI
jgi:hypothetical protein